MTTTYTDQSQARGETIKSRKDYPDNPTGRHSYWDDELKGSLYMLKRWHRQGDVIVNRYRDERGGDSAVARTADNPPGQSPGSAFRLNLFYSNTVTLQGILYSQVPKVDVSRRHDDANDDVARVAAVIMERLLNNDVTENADHYDSVLRSTLQDRLLPGLGIARVRYDVKTSTDPVTQQPIVLSEAAPVDYFHWRDVAWSWTRTWDKMRWIAFRSYMSKDAFKKRFPDTPIDDIDFKPQKMTNAQPSEVAEQPDQTENWERAEVWEIWDKATRKVVWFTKSHDKILDSKDDPLQLRGFFPTPRFFLANPTTSLFIPTPDYHMSADLYAEIDILQTRIAVITEAVRVVGVYDAAQTEIKRMLDEGTDNTLIPVSKWAMFAEKGGLKGQIDWFPLEDVVNALVNLRQLRDETIALLYQVTGLSDIFRGQLDNQYEGVAQSQMKTNLGSIRLQSLQGQYATFAADLMRLKAEIVCKHFQHTTIATQANVQALQEDPGLVQAALSLMKDPSYRYRVSIDPEALAQVDYQQQQAEATEYLTALSTFMQAAAPLTEQSPATAPFIMQLLQWGLSKFKGGEVPEGILDKAIAASQQQAQQPQPDPEAQRLEAQTKLEQAKAEAQLAIIQAKTKSAVEQRNADLVADIRTRQADHQMEMAQSVGEMERDLALTKAKAEADVWTESMTSQINMAQQEHATGTEARKDIIDHQLELDGIAAQTKASIAEAVFQAEIEELRADSDADRAAEAAARDIDADNTKD